jgi:hypothetical protein
MDARARKLRWCAVLAIAVVGVMAQAPVAAAKHHVRLDAPMEPAERVAATGGAATPVDPAKIVAATGGASLTPPVRSQPQPSPVTRPSSPSVDGWVWIAALAASLAVAAGLNTYRRRRSGSPAY